MRLQPAQLLAGVILDVLRHAGLGDRLLELGQLRGLAFLAFAELLLNRGHLLAQQHLALALVERGLGLLADLGGQPQHLDALRQQTRHLVHPRRDVDGLEDFLLFLRLDVHVRGGEIGQTAWRIDALDRRDQFLRRLRQQFEGFDRLAAQMHQPRLDLGRAAVAIPGCAAPARRKTANRSGIPAPGNAARPGRRDAASRPVR